MEFRVQLEGRQALRQRWAGNSLHHCTGKRSLRPKAVHQGTPATFLLDPFWRAEPALALNDPGAGASEHQFNQLRLAPGVGFLKNPLKL